MPKVSIITPVFADIPEKVDWLDEAIQSVKKQSFQDWEMIIVDDASPYSPSPIQMKHEEDTRIRWMKAGGNYGPAMCRNTAAELALSDCLLPLDADDLLGSERAIEAMYELWQLDKTKIIFGNLQRLLGSDDGSNFQLQSKVIELGAYSFEENMKLMGVMPVTAMHSIRCFDAAGRWKDELKQGLEDVEYWLSAGKAGYCGEKINETVLIYRRQPQSRTHLLKFVNKHFEKVQAQIRAMHPDIYEKGEFPMSCCGGKGAQQALAAMNNSANPRTGMVTEMEGFDEGQLLWVEYNGGRQGKFSMLGRANTLKSDYVIYGTGHKFQIHRDDVPFFQARARLGFLVGVPDPRAPQAPAQPNPQQQARWESPTKGQLATVERIDPIGAAAREIQQQPANPPAPAEPPPSAPQEDKTDGASYQLSLAALGLGKQTTETLEAAAFTIPMLAEAEPEELTAFKGIGAKRAEAIIQKAKELIIMA